MQLDGAAPLFRLFCCSAVCRFVAHTRTIVGDVFSP